MNSAALRFVPVNKLVEEGYGEYKKIFSNQNIKNQFAVFAGGCFWCTESDFEKIKGVLSATSGYAGGTTINPTYKLVSSGKTKHAEVVLIEFDPRVITYQKLLDHFWTSIDPTTKDQQFCDKGPQYRSAIMPLNEIQKKEAEISKINIQNKNNFNNIYTTIELLNINMFYKAEEEHQDYYKKHWLKYRYYRSGCGRDKRLEEIWGNKNN